ncbi:fibrinogen-like protein A [Anopheles albimanus]|uniref:fibrinogen-like protein A n=1 Tax=Anopheles albimanus TaxID=7167 RepID=UPI0016418FD0|nr:fibrinogen-like protein A [Anopheles albimanus]
MKFTVCFILFCAAFYASATHESSDSSAGALETLSSEGIMRFGLEVLLNKLENIDSKLLELQIEQQELQKQIMTIGASCQKISTTTAGLKTTTPKLNQPPFQSCKDVPYNVSREYLISLNNDSTPTKVFCEQEKFNGSWMVVQHRVDGSNDFNRNWAEYRDGFGSGEKEFWLGLEKMHRITSTRPHEIIFEMKDFSGNYGYAHYNKIKIDSESEQYRLTLGMYSGTAGDSMTYNNGMKFSTKDRDNDLSATYDCAQLHEGAWWYSACSLATLNAPYRNVSNGESMYWYNFKTDYRALSYSRMMIREL